MLLTRYYSPDKTHILPTWHSSPDTANQTLSPDTTHPTLLTWHNSPDFACQTILTRHYSPDITYQILLTRHYSPDITHLTLLTRFCLPDITHQTLMHVGHCPHLRDICDDLLLGNEGLICGEVGDEDHRLLGVERSHLLLRAHSAVQLFAISAGLKSPPAGQGSKPDRTALCWGLLPYIFYTKHFTLYPCTQFQQHQTVLHNAYSTKRHYITSQHPSHTRLHYTTLISTSLHHTKLHNLDYIGAHYATSNSVTWHYITSHSNPDYIRLYYTTPHYKTLTTSDLLY